MFKLTAVRSQKSLASSRLTEKRYDASVISTLRGIDIRFATSSKQRGSVLQDWYPPAGL
jgi:hypothetical protein